MLKIAFVKPAFFGSKLLFFDIEKFYGEAFHPISAKMKQRRLSNLVFMSEKIETGQLLPAKNRSDSSQPNDLFRG